MPALSSLDLAGVARFLLAPECKSVSILTGAGVSVAAGIPDFRSPGGMYSTLRPELITATPAQRVGVARELRLEFSRLPAKLREPGALETERSRVRKAKLQAAADAVLRGYDGRNLDEDERFRTSGGELINTTCEVWILYDSRDHLVDLFFGS